MPPPGEAGKLITMSYTRRAINLPIQDLRNCAESQRFRFFTRDPDPESGALPVVATTDLDRIDPAETELVWGHGVVDAAKPGDTSLVPALALIGANPLDLVRFALRTEGRAGAYGWEEQRRIAEYCERNRINLEAVCDLVDPDGDYTHNLERYRALSPELRSWVNRGVCDLRTAERITSIPKDRMRSIEFIMQRLSFSNRRRFLVMAQEVVRRDGAASLQDILGDSSSAGEGSGETPDAGEDSAAILERLRRVRYPEYSTFEATLERVNHEHLRGTGVRVDAPKNFEGGALTVSFSFSSPAELERRLRGAHRITEKSDELLGLLFGNDR